MKIKLSLKLLLVVPFLVSSCTINRPIVYNVRDVHPYQDQKLSRLVLDIEEFSDTRKLYPENEILFKKKLKTRVDREQVCINSERHYKKDPVVTQFTQQLEKHLNQRRSFGKVVINKKDSADYYITGNLSRFYGKQDFSTKAAVGAAFGLVGALATAGAKTDGEIIIEITDLKIYNKKNEVIKDLGMYRKTYEGEFRADAYCWCIFDNTNLKLEEYFSQLIFDLETEVKNYESKLAVVTP